MGSPRGFRATTHKFPARFVEELRILRPFGVLTRPSLMTYMIRIFIFLLCSSSVSHLFAAEFVQPKPVEPTVAKASGEAEEAMAGVRIPKNWKIELVAAEPDVANVVAFDIDNRGRVFVCETFRQTKGVTDNRAHDDAWVLADLASETVQDRIDYHKRLLGETAITYAQQDDRIRRLEDTNGDGKFDRSTVLVNGFNKIEEGTGAGVLVRGSEIYYSNIPKLWKLVDENDDGIADEKVSMHDGFGVRVAFRGHDLHGVTMGVDGRVYFTIGDRGYHVTTKDGRLLANPESGAVFRCELDGSNLEAYATGLRNPQELAFNDLGDLFSVDNNSDSGDQARIVQVLEEGDSGWRMHYQYLPDRGPFNRERLWEPFDQEQAAYIVPPITNLTDGPSGLVYYPGTGFGDQLDDTFLICDFRGGPSNSGIRSFKLKRQGAFYQLAADSDPIWSVLATDVAFGPDGGLYVSDWVNGWNGLGKGRMYRITNPDTISDPIVEEVRGWLASDWSTHEVEQLAELLSHTDRRVRLEAQWELAKRGEVETLNEAVGDHSRSTIHRLHALWGVDQVFRGADDKTVKHRETFGLIRGLITSTDVDPVLQSAAIKFLGDQRDHRSAEQIMSLLNSSSSRVSYQAAIAIGKLKTKTAFDPLVMMAATNDNQDPALRHAAVLGLSKAASEQQLAALAQHPSVSVRRVAVVALRRIKSGAIAEFLSDSSPLVALESARAIHDLPIHEAMPALAKLADSSLDDAELARRVVNANFRIGSAESANSLVEIASREELSQEVRIDAINALKDWMDTDPRDRVLNAYRPLGERTQDHAAAALERRIDRLTSATDEVREAAIDAASTLGIKKIVPFLEERATNTDYPAAERANVMVGLAKLDPVKAVAIAKNVNLRPSSPFVLAAMNILAEHDRENSVELFLQATESRDTGLQALGWDILSSVDAESASQRIMQGVEQYLDGSLDSAVHLNVLEAAKGNLSASLEAKLAAHQENLVQQEPLGKWLACLDGGDIKSGRKLFFEKTELSCLRCHKVKRAGGEVGPNLTIIGKKKDRRYLLEAIAIPDAAIAEGYETAVIVNDSGEIYTGIVRFESDEEVELLLSDGATFKINQDEIVARRKGRSSMPGDLTKFMTQRELRDLVAYLASLQVNPRKTEDVE